MDSSRTTTTNTNELIPANGLDDGGRKGAEEIVCNGCKAGLEETSDSVVVSFGSSLWHVDCRCAKCHNLVEHDTNLLLLSDGSPVCENCSYICSVCQKPISNEAIVTGDESYHADCFRCRACSNKIEELIFAKTSQGIWCMACHNERVARSRKHAESKKNRSDRKEREARRLERERDASGTASVPLTGESGGYENDYPTSAASTSGTFDAGVHPSSTRQPLPSTPSTSTSLASLDHKPSHAAAPATLDGRQRISDTGRQYHDGAQASPSLSSQSLAGLARGSSPSGSSRAPTPLSPALGASEREAASLANLPPSPSLLAFPTYAGVIGRRASVDRSPLPGQGSRSSPLPPPPSRPIPPYSPSSSTSDRVPSSPRQVDALVHHQAKQGSLSAPPPVDRAANRRSGFYGAQTRSSLEEISTVTGTEEVAGLRIKSPGLQVSTGSQETPPSSPPLVLPLPQSGTTSLSFLPELHNSVSFYDPDTLLFLDHVASEPNSPRSESMADMHGHASMAAGGETRANGRTSSGRDSGRLSGLGREPSPKSEVARQLRESIRLSRQGSSQGGVKGMSMDIDLVELLLVELDGTKKQMQELQSKYSAFRRASRSAFEGFSMARDEYDKEVAARRDAEAKMVELRLKLTEQALALAAVNKEQRTADALRRDSKELRLSVVGMEQHLSQLRAEVALSTAQVEELVAVDTDTHRTLARNSVSRADIVRSLNTRLEAVKADHRREIELLLQQRDELSREITEFQAIRASFSDEAAALKLRNTALVDRNSEATRQLDTLRDTIASLRGTTYFSASSPANIPSSPSTSSFSAAPVYSARTPSTPLRSIPSSSQVNDPQDVSIVQRLPGTEQIGAKKFKWGKGKPEPARSVLPATASTGPKPSSTTGRAAELGRIHTFQQTSILRPVRCEYCGDKMWGLNEVRCGACGCYSHSKCAGYLKSSCVSQAVEDSLVKALGGPAMFGNDLTAQAQSEGRQVPLVVTKCIAAVESYGMNYEGVYRKTGGMGQTKLITQCFERGQDFDLEDVDKFNDLAAVTSCMKNFFRSLPDPLFTHDLHESFVSSVELPEGEERLSALERSLYRLPEAHFFTARMLIGHLHHVHLRSSENKMTPANLGVVFGPTLLRSINPAREFSDMGFKAKIVELMVNHHPQLFSRPFLAPHPL